MSDIGPGSLVRCVDDSRQYRAHPSEALVVAGIIYTVREVVDFTGPGYRLVEIVNPPVSCGHFGVIERAFGSCRFTPINDEDIAIFRQLVADPPKELVE